jgi:hypothetical protein
MKTNDYKDLRRQVIDRYETTVAEAQDRRDAELAAIDTVWNLLHKKKKKQPSDTQQPQANPAIPESPQPTHGSLVKAVKKALEIVPSTFTTIDILEAIRRSSEELAAKCKASSLSGCLIRLERSNLIETVTKGKGSTPTVYRKRNQIPKEPLFEKSD